METDRADRLRAEVRRLKTRSGRLRTLPTLLHVGLLGGARLVVPVPGSGAAAGPAGVAGPTDGPDRALAADLVTRALDRMGSPADQQVWLTRSGGPEVLDLDWLWRGATWVGRGRHGVRGGAFYVVTRHGWLELPSGEQRSWRRMRATWKPPCDDDRGDPVCPDPVEGWPVGC